MARDNEEYLQPSELCNFDRSPEIVERARALTADCHSGDEMFRSIFSFVKELPYGLEDWDVAASETLAKGWGMCSGKTNLLVALLRSVGIPAGYRVYRIRPEASLWEWITQDGELARHMGHVHPEQDHVDCEVWLDRWRECDPSRDTPFERGLRELGISLEREAVAGESGRVEYLKLASFDRWARERQERRAFRENRDELFAWVNEQFRRIRSLGGE